MGTAASEDLAQRLIPARALRPCGDNVLDGACFVCGLPIPVGGEVPPATGSGDSANDAGGVSSMLGPHGSAPSWPLDQEPLSPSPAQHVPPLPVPPPNPLLQLRTVDATLVDSSLGSHGTGYRLHERAG